MKTALSQSSPALVLRTRVYGESDKIVTFLTRDVGKLSGIARGALRSKRRFVNVLEPFTHLKLGFRVRSRSDLVFVEWAEIVRPVRNLTRDLDRYAWATYVLELVDCMVEGREAEPALFDLAEGLLAEIDTSYPGPLSADLLRYFEARLLDLTGFEPRLDVCSVCGADSVGTARLRFNPRYGTLRCEPCGDDSGMPVSAAAVDAILRIRRRDLEPALTSPLANEVRLLLQTAIAHHARRPLRSPSLLRTLLTSS